MKYAVIQTGGKQYRVAEGDILELEHLEGEKNQSITFNEVLLYTNGEKITLGTPLIDGVSVAAVILDHIRGEKIRVAKFKAKSRYRRVNGHRQSLSKVQISTISDGKQTKTTEVKPAVETKAVKAKTTEKPNAVKKLKKA